MSKENRMKIVLFLLGISFPIIGGILTRYVEDCVVLLLIGGVAGMSFCLAWAFKVYGMALLFASVLCPAIFFWLNHDAFKVGPSKEYIQLMQAIQAEKARENWDAVIGRYVENRACRIGMFMEEDMKEIIAECRQREPERMRDKLENEANGGRKRDRKLWWLQMSKSILFYLLGLSYLSLKEIAEIHNRQEAKCKGVNDAEISC